MPKKQTKTRAKAPTLRSDKSDLSVLRKEENQILTLLNNKGKGFPVYSLNDIQQQCFGSRKAKATGLAQTAAFLRKKGTRYNCGPKTASNFLRRLVRCNLVERPKTASRGAYKISAHGRRRIKQFEKAQSKASTATP